MLVPTEGIIRYRSCATNIQAVSASNQRFDDHIQEEAAPNSSMKRSCAMQVAKRYVKTLGVEYD